MRSFTCSLTLLFTCLSLFSQDPRFSHPYNAPLYLNPALAGSTGAGRFASLFRDQWPGLTYDYKVLYLSYDHMLNSYNSGLGMYFMRDDAGTLKNNLLGFAYSYKLELADKKLRINPGLDFNLLTSLLDTSNLTLPGEELYTQKNNFDMGFGMQATTARINAGAVVRHLLQPNVSFTKGGSARLGLKYTGIFDYTLGDIKENKAFKINLGLFYEMQYGFEHYTGTLVAAWRKFRLGAGYSSGDVLILKAAWEGTIFRLRYSYDIYTGSFLSNSGGSHEVSTLFNLFRKKKKDDFLEMNNFHF
ncbi:MAG: PorP/SprF family type IX secretion system membrane protein [Bacteroidia bacterium]|nr:PorP/SprF family type IX secretion system membrane protein [Bacteroidia bacterium]